MNVIWIVSDTFRRDDVGVYGNEVIRTPAVDALAAKSVRFDRHYIGNFPTMPARADFMTGRWTMAYLQWEPLPEDEVTIAELASKGGFHTAAIGDNPFLTRHGMFYDRGFRSFYNIPGQNIPSRGEAPDIVSWWRHESDRFGPQTFIKSMDWLERHYKDDFFLYMDVWDPHEPWDAPNYYTELYWPDYDGEVIHPPYVPLAELDNFPEERLKKTHATYRGELTMVDTWLGYFLKRLENMNLMENTAIIFTADHGFYFGEHGFIGKLVYNKRPDGTRYGYCEDGAKWGYSPLYEEVAAVPLVIYAPGIQAGVFKGLTSHVDLMPTVLDLLGQEIPSCVEGRSLLPYLNDTSLSGRDYVVSSFMLLNPGDEVSAVDHTKRVHAEGSSSTITTEEWSFVYGLQEGVSELFHLPSDPKQEKNLIEDNEKQARELHQLFLKFLKERGVPERFLETRRELKI